MRLSFSKIWTYLECPLKFYFQYIKKLPTKPKPYFSFGKSIHLALSEFHKLPPYPPLESLIESLIKNWISEGYSSKEEELRELERAKEILRRYYFRNIFNYQKAFAVEQKVIFKINGIEMISYIDRIDKIGDDYEIVEYKTGKNGLAYKSLGLLDESNLLQMSIYKIAAQEILKKKPKYITLYYLSLPQEKIKLDIPEEKIEESKNIILEVYKKIEEGYFPKRENKFCNFCDFRKECELWKK